LREWKISKYKVKDKTNPKTLSSDQPSNLGAKKILNGEDNTHSRKPETLSSQFDSTAFPSLSTSKELKENGKQGWICSACTLNNKNDTDICAACGTNKNKIFTTVEKFSDSLVVPNPQEGPVSDSSRKGIWKVLSSVLLELDQPLIEYLAGLFPCNRSKTPDSDTPSRVNVSSSEAVYEILGDLLISYDAAETEEDAQVKCEAIFKGFQTANLLSGLEAEKKEKQKRLYPKKINRPN